MLSVGFEPGTLDEQATVASIVPSEHVSAGIVIAVVAWGSNIVPLSQGFCVRNSAHSSAGGESEGVGVFRPKYVSSISFMIIPQHYLPT